LITEGSGGRIFELTEDHEVVWEYISPYWGKLFHVNMVYRAYRVPYAWIPQIDSPKEIPIEPIDVTTFRMPGASKSGPNRVVQVEGVLPYRSSSALCVETDIDEKNNK
jgi:hypothetical protein